MDNDIKIIPFSRGTVIIVEDSLNDGYFYILKSGTVAIQSDLHFYDKTSHKYLAGDTFGLVSGLTRNPARHTLIAESECEVIRIPVSMLGKYFHENREICLKIISSYSNQLRALNNYLVTKKPDQDNESPVKLLDAGQLYYNNKQYDLASHCFYHYIKWAKENKPKYQSIEHAQRLLDEIAPDYKPPEHNTHILKVKADDIICVEHEPTDYFYVIEKGAVKISKLVNDEEFILCILREGEIFGEMSILNKKLRNASAIVFEDATLLRLEVGSFMEEIGEKLLLTIFESFARRVWYAHQRVALLEMGDPNAKLYAYLQILISDVNAKKKSDHSLKDEYIFAFSINDLKKMVGITELSDESIREFLTDKNIEISNHVIRIKDSKKVIDRVALYKHRFKKKKKMHHAP